MLGLPLYKWQASAILPLEWATGPNGKRQNIAICTPNGSGKDERIIPAAAFWWLYYHPRGRVVITSKSDMQLTTQTIPNIKRHYQKFGWPTPVESPRFTLTTPTGGSLVAYVTNEGARAEGHHSRPGEPLLMIVNEAKSVGPGIFEGIDRCSPDVLMLISSPGLREGRFFECFQLPLVQFYHTIRVGLTDCPHITQEKIDHTIAKYGLEDPTTRSMLFGEFMTQADGEQYCITREDYESCIYYPPQWKPGFRFGFFDFADGRAENVLVIRDGNKYEVADAWRSINEDAVVARALQLIRHHNLKPEQVKGDAAAKSILDKMASVGFPIGRQNFGAKDKSGIYKSWSAMAWLEGAQKIRRREVILPDDLTLKAQVTCRKKELTPDGRWAVEEKMAMLKERQIESPDRADALFGCMSEPDTSMIVKPVPLDLSAFNFNDTGEASELALCVGL